MNNYKYCLEYSGFEYCYECNSGFAVSENSEECLRHSAFCRNLDRDGQCRYCIDGYFMNGRVWERSGVIPLGRSYGVGTVEALGFVDLLF